MLLPESLLLLALGRGGRIPASRLPALRYALPGSVLLELALRGLVEVQDDRVIASEASPTGEELLDSALRQVKEGGRLWTAGFWVRGLAAPRGRWRDYVAERLVDRGVLASRRAWLPVPGLRRWPVRDAAVVAEVHETVRAALAADGDPAPRVALLVSLAEACKLTTSLAERGERRRARRRARAIAKGESVGAEVSEAVRQVQGAAVVASYGASTFLPMGAADIGGGAIGGGDGGGGGGGG